MPNVSAASRIGWVVAPLLALFGLATLLDAHCAASSAEYDRQRQHEAADEKARQEEGYRREAAEIQAKKDVADAKERAERALDTGARTTQILAALPDVCEARRLLRLAADPKAASLARARDAIHAAVGRELAKERPAFAASRGLTCSDGSPSATCTCNGPHQGCCSHHGGVAGCEPFPTDIECSH